MDILEDTQKLIADSKIHYNDIALAGGVSSRWVYRFMNNEYIDVGVRRIQRLRNYLLTERAKL